MSAVYKGTDPNLRRTVAIKLIHGHLSEDPQFVSRFEEEAAAVAQLKHPNIIQVYDFDNDGDTYYMVLEFVPGETLQARLRHLHQDSRHMPPEEVRNLVAGVCDALEYAHQRGMIHRDVKPANVMITPEGQPILMDFGIAKIVGGKQHTATGNVIGTAAYISPEQVRGETLDARVDIYALGVMLFEMLSGRPPFEGDSAMTVMLKHVNEPVPDLTQFNPDVPPALVAVTMKALEKNRDSRYRSSADMAAALRSADLTAESTGLGTASPAGAGGSAAAEHAAGALRCRLWIRRTPQGSPRFKPWRTHGLAGGRGRAGCVVGLRRLGRLGPVHLLKDEWRAGRSGRDHHRQPASGRHPSAADHPAHRDGPATVRHARTQPHAVTDHAGRPLRPNRRHPP